MSRAPTSRGRAAAGRSARKADRPRSSSPRVPSVLRRERPWVVLLLAAHAALAIWGAARNSVTFDENFHLPAGVMIASRAELRISAVNPPLLKALGGVAALAAGARLPSPEALANGEQAVVGESFMRRNADRYHRVFLAARVVVVALSVLLGWLVWRFARDLHGPLGGLAALGFYAFAPEALAHAGVFTMDLATGLGWLATIFAFLRFARSGSRRAWLACTLAIGFTFLVRFTAVALAPVLLVLAAWWTLRRRIPRPGRLWAGLLLMVPAVIVVVDLGYLGHVSLAPLGEWTFRSHAFLALQRAVPWLRLPLPSIYLLGFDRQLVESQAGTNVGFLLDTLYPGSRWYYFPLAFLFKWPLGFLAAIAARAAQPFLRPAPAARPWASALAVPIAIYLVSGMVSGLNIGIRYMFPILPLLCVWLAGLVPTPDALPAVAWRRWSRAALLLLGLQAVETSLCAPWYLAFYNWPSGGPGGGYRLVNDSNVDWGQGLIALRDDMRRLGIPRIHLAYHGTTDPAVYGIDYVPYFGGDAGPESDWLCVSSYYFVGLAQRMMTSSGRTDFIHFDFRPLWDERPAARPGRCMMLFRIR